MTIDPLNLQRMIDGELDRQQIQAMLKSADDQPESWREIAIAFVEDQIWKQEFQSGDSGRFNKVAMKSDVLTDRDESNHRTLALLGRWGALAACLLVAVGIGYWSGLEQTNNRSGDNSTTIADAVPILTTNQIASSVDTATSGLNQVSYRPDYHMQLNDPNGKSLLNSEIPLYEYEHAKKIGYDMRTEAIPSDLQQELLNRGYQLNQDLNYVSGRLEDGREFVVPIRTINMVPGQ